MIRAKVICDSIYKNGTRLTTMEVEMHRFVLAEFNTHRVFSRNSASSRAIPIHKQIERIKKDPAYPVEFGSNQAGMQAGVPLSGLKYRIARRSWWLASRLALVMAMTLMKLGVHKQVTNRLLEPFMWHTVIVTATDFSNFFGLRDNEMAQPEIHAAAKAMRKAYNESTPKQLKIWEWHLPYLQDDENLVFPGEPFGTTLSILDNLKQISAARCARVSFLTHDGVRDQSKDIELYDRLSSADPAHASPMEHVAKPCPENMITIWDEDVLYQGALIGNFTGWLQLRHEKFLPALLEGESSES